MRAPLDERLALVEGVAASSMTKAEIVALEKLAIKEAIAEWLEEKATQFGWWSIKGIAAAAFAALAYFILLHTGWVHR